MPTIELSVENRISRHLAAVRIMSYMVYPDNPERREASEIIFRTRLADWYSGTYAKRSLELQKELLQSAESKLGKELSRAYAHPSEWMRNRLFSDFLKPFGDLYEAAEWTRRWFAVVYTGKLVCLIGSIAQHHARLGASLNKAIHILRETEGNDKELNAGFKQLGYDDVAFRTFCLVAKSVEQFVTEFRPHGLRQALIPEEEIFRLPNEICVPATPLQNFRPLTASELAALGTYRAPKSFVY